MHGQNIKIRTRKFLNSERPKTIAMYNELNKLHNPTGPAIILYNKSGKVISQHYFLFGKQVSKDEFLINYYS